MASTTGNRRILICSACSLKKATLRPRVFGYNLPTHLHSLPRGTSRQPCATYRCKRAAQFFQIPIVPSARHAHVIFSGQICPWATQKAVKNRRCTEVPLFPLIAPVPSVGTLPSCNLTPSQVPSGCCFPHVWRTTTWDSQPQHRDTQSCPRSRQKTARRFITRNGAKVSPSCSVMVGRCQPTTGTIK